MFTIERLIRELASFPVLVRIGLVVMAVAGVGDVVAHLEAADHVGHLHEHTSTEFQAHLAGFVSMVIVFVGVVADGVRQNRLRRPAGTDSNGVA